MAKITPVRVQRSRKKGKGFVFSLGKENSLPIAYVGRPTKWGNPFFMTDGFICFRFNKTAYVPLSDLSKITENEQQAELVNCYKKWLNGRKKFYGINVKSLGIQPIPKETIKQELVGKNLACWCGIGKTCHADILLKIANG